MDGYTRHDIRRWVDDVLLHTRSDGTDDKKEVFELGKGATVEAGDHENLSARSEPVLEFIDDSDVKSTVSAKTASTTKTAVESVKSVKSTESVSVAGSTPTEPDLTIEPPTFTESLPPPPVTFTIGTITASVQPQPITTLTPITHSARPPPTKTKDQHDKPEKTSSATVTDGFVTVTTSSSSTPAITTSVAVISSATTSAFTSATASPAINNGAALEEAQQKETAHGHMSGGAKAGIAIGVVGKPTRWFPLACVAS